MKYIYGGMKYMPTDELYTPRVKYIDRMNCIDMAELHRG
jgi:hypothetical protein